MTLVVICMQHGKTRMEQGHLDIPRPRMNQSGKFTTFTSREVDGVWVTSSILIVRTSSILVPSYLAFKGMHMGHVPRCAYVRQGGVSLEDVLMGPSAEKQPVGLQGTFFWGEGTFLEDPKGVNVVKGSSLMGSFESRCFEMSPTHIQMNDERASRSRNQNKNKCPEKDSAKSFPATHKFSPDVI